MELNDYQKKALETAVYPGKNMKEGIEYTLFGLVGEAGELANKYKKILRNETNPYREGEHLIDELGDVLWYCSAFAKELGYTLEEVCQLNIAKLAARKLEGTLKDRKE